MIKNFVLDTNILLEDENALEILINGKDGGDKNCIYIPWIVLEELDGLKKDIKKAHRVSKAVEKLHEFKENIQILSNNINTDKNKINDNKILEEIKKSDISDLVLVTNDKMLQFKAFCNGIAAEGFKHSSAFQSTSQKYTGFVNFENGEELINNCFYWKNGKMYYNQQGTEKCVDYENAVWGITPKSPYQNALMELGLDKNIDILTVQSAAGFGKTQCALALALQLLAEKDEEGSKKYKKIFIFKPNWEIGNELGFLPGAMSDKLEPYFRPIRDLILKLHDIRQCNKIFEKDRETKKVNKEMEFDSKKLEMLPINFIRGMNLENCIVIIDEIQNMSRLEARSLLSRMGENVKCIITGDVEQIDNPNLNQDTNALSWIVSKFKNSPNYGHIVLSGKHSRGPIADLVRIKEL